MMNHSDVIWRYAETLTRQAEIDGRCFNQPIISALSIPQTTRRRLRILGFR